MKAQGSGLQHPPRIHDGKPCIRGLRYPVESILEWLASGVSQMPLRTESIAAMMS